MIIQNILFPTYGICSNYDLYFRLNNNYNYSFQNRHIFMNAGGWAHFDTYFNGFIYNKWSKYTKLSNLSLELEVKGTLRITLLYKERKNDSTVINKFLHEIEINAVDKQTVKIPIEDFSDKGMYAFSVYALSNNCFLYGGRYVTDISHKEIKEVTLGLSICTYKREKYILKNITNLSKQHIDNPKSLLNNHIHIFISDNANTLSTKIKPSENIHLYPNKNVGGAGGFTRCLIEILNNKDLNITHALLMDDDITIDPEVIYRTFSFLSLIKDEYEDIFVGGAMLRLDNQNIQTESGAIWNAGRLRSLKQNLNLSSCEACLYNDIEESCDYNAWWYCTIPMCYINENNLPLPIFIRGDDVEYGLRNVKHIVQLNGICVWHEPFENKYSSMMYYYIFRNRLIDNSIRSIEYPLKDLLNEFLVLWNCEVKLLRYKNAHLLVDGILDFMKGIDWLKSTDAEELNNKIRSQGYSLQHITELTAEYSYSRYMESKNYTESKLSLIRRIRVKYNLQNHDQFLIIPTFNPNPNYCINANRILNYDYVSGKGFVTEYNKEVYKSEKKYLKHMLKILKHNYDKVCEEYKLRSSELTNINFWKEYLKLL